MSISSEVQRISDNRDRIRAKLVALGLAQSTDKLDDLVADIEAITSNGPISETIDGLVNTSADIPAGFTEGGSVSLTDAIENALKAI